MIADRYYGSAHKHQKFFSFSKSLRCSTHIDIPAGPESERERARALKLPKLSPRPPAHPIRKRAPRPKSQNAWTSSARALPTHLQARRHAKGASWNPGPGHPPPLDTLASRHAWLRSYNRLGPEGTVSGSQSSAGSGIDFPSPTVVRGP